MNPIETSVQLSCYGAFEGFTNQRVASLLAGNTSLQHVYRGEIKFLQKIKPASQEFIEEIKAWLKNKYVIHNIFIEKYGAPVTTFFIEDKLGFTLDSNKNTILTPIFCALIFSTDRLDYEIYSNSINHALKIADTYEEKFKSGKPSKETINFAFWQKDDDGAASLNNNENACPSLEEIATNYPTTLNAVKKLINLEDPYKHGKIVLWTGPAGNGKTHLIRALARAWSEKYEIVPEVIIDPESLYEIPSYLTSLLLHGSGQVYSDRIKKQIDPPFRLIIAEDCAQLFSVDCRNQTGFARLLNTADGLLGQGQKLIFLFTANEHIGTIDPAILRPGRCLQNLEIPDWSIADARNWLIDRGAENKIKHLENRDSITLAELYAILNDTMYAEHRSNFGFK